MASWKALIIVLSIAKVIAGQSLDSSFLLEGDHRAIHARTTRDAISAICRIQRATGRPVPTCPIPYPSGMNLLVMPDKKDRDDWEALSRKGFYFICRKFIGKICRQTRFGGQLPALEEIAPLTLSQNRAAGPVRNLTYSVRERYTARLIIGAVCKLAEHPTCVNPHAHGTSIYITPDRKNTVDDWTRAARLGFNFVCNTFHHKRCT